MSQENQSSQDDGFIQPLSVFDGFIHRPYQEDCDGWMKTQPDARHYPIVKHAREVLDLFESLRAAERRIWELERELALWKK